MRPSSLRSSGPSVRSRTSQTCACEALARPVPPNVVPLTGIFTPVRRTSRFLSLPLSVPTANTLPPSATKRLTLYVPSELLAVLRGAGHRDRIRERRRGRLSGRSAGAADQQQRARCRGRRGGQ